MGFNSGFKGLIPRCRFEFGNAFYC